jgi:hypothetical protein
LESGRAGAGLTDYYCYYCTGSSQFPSLQFIGPSVSPSPLSLDNQLYSNHKAPSHQQQLQLQLRAQKPISVSTDSRFRSDYDYDYDSKLAEIGNTLKNRISASFQCVDGLISPKPKVHLGLKTYKKHSYRNDVLRNLHMVATAGILNNDFCKKNKKDIAPEKHRKSPSVGFG